MKQLLRLTVLGTRGSMAACRSDCRIFGGDKDGKIRMLMDYTDRPGDVSDPWYSGDYKTAYRDIYEGCEGLLKSIE